MSSQKEQVQRHSNGPSQPSQGLPSLQVQSQQQENPCQSVASVCVCACARVQPCHHTARQWLSGALVFSPVKGSDK